MKLNLEYYRGRNKMKLEKKKKKEFSATTIKENKIKEEALCFFRKRPKLISLCINNSRVFLFIFIN